MAKLKLGAIADDKPVKLTVELPADVHRDLAADTESYGYEGLDDTPANVMTFDLGTVCCRDQLRQQEILKFSSRVIMAEKDRLIPQVGPVDRLLPSQLMSLRQGHQDALAPQRQG